MAFFGLGEIDHRAGLHAARDRVRNALDLDGVAAAAQHVLRRLRLQPRDQAGDLAGADVERGHDSACAWRETGFIFGVTP